MTVKAFKRSGVLLLSVFALSLSFRAAQAAPLEGIRQYHTSITSYHTFLTDTSIYGRADTGALGFDLHNGILPYIQDWWAHVGSYKPSGTSAFLAETTTGIATNGWITRCTEMIEQIGEIKKLSDGYLALAENPSTSEETATKIEEEMKKLAGLTLLITGTAELSAGNLCGRAFVNMYVMMRNHGEFCFANEMAAPQCEPDTPKPGEECQGSPTGSCSDWKYANLKLGVIPNCSQKCALVLKVQTYSYSAGITKGFIEGIKKAIEDHRKTFNELGGVAKKEEQKAAKIKAEQDAEARAQAGKGSVLGLPLPLSDIAPEALIGRFIRQLLGVVGAVALLMFVYGGLRYMIAAKSGSGEKEVAVAKNILTWATLGLIAIFSAYAVVNFVIDALRK